MNHFTPKNAPEPKYIERIRELYAMLSGVPEDRVSLLNWREGPDDSVVSDARLLKDCGTVACIGGWACAYPKFKAVGLRTYLGDPVFDGFYSMSGIARFLGIDCDSARAIFIGSYSGLDAGIQYDASDKQRALRRIRLALLGWGAITRQRSAELAAAE